jgi:C-terminal processing protease CtpA/Prc
MKDRASVMSRRILLAPLFVLGLTACPEDAKEDLRDAADAARRAGNKLEDAAEKTNAHVEDKLEVAANRATNLAEAARDMADPDAAARDAAAAISCEGEACTIEASEFDKLVANPLSVASQLTVSPQENAGATRWRIDDVKDGSACERLGLKAGDFVLRVNGETLGNPPSESILDELRKADKVVLELDRGGEKVRREIRRRGESK